MSTTTMNIASAPIEVKRIYWPKSTISYTDSGYLVGWKYSTNDLIVVTTITSYQSFANFLVDYCKNQDQSVDIKSLCILGTFNCSADILPGDKYEIDCWIKVQQSTELSHPRVFDSASTPLKINLHIIYYHPPQPRKMQFLSLEPLSLLLLKDSFINKSNPEYESMQHQQILLKKLKLHFPRRKENSWKRSLRSGLIELLNQSFEVRMLTHENNNKTNSYVFRLFDRVSSSTFYFFNSLFAYFIILLRIINEVILLAINYRPILLSYNMMDIFVSARQVDLRLQQACFWPVQYMKLWVFRKSKRVAIEDYKEYIRFYNNLWLVANDMIFGITMSSFILENLHLVVKLIENITFEYAIKNVRSMVIWLVDTPAGLKLNNDICKFIMKLSVWVIDVWSNFLLHCLPWTPFLVQVVAISGFGGASLMIALISDFLSVMTIHIHLLYLASSRLYNWQLRVIYSLLQLFRGKKRNVLRNRIDSYEYDLDQLLLGTILFTVLIFFLPTIYVFYAAFALTRVSVMTCLAICETMLAFLNHFPLFVTMLRIKDPYRIPSGLNFEIVSFEPLKQDGFATLYLNCNSKPMSLGSMFEHYRKLARRLISHYLSKTTLISLLVGCPVPAIPAEQLYNIQYAMLPTKRISIRKLRDLLFHQKKFPYD